MLHHFCRVEIGCFEKVFSGCVSLVLLSDLSATEGAIEKCDPWKVILGVGLFAHYTEICFIIHVVSQAATFVVGFIVNLYNFWCL